ncbi:MAG: GNAT family N-acetyltransferase [bacterium]|nr:GNAT family N-acetyltransferase [bacterium]
MDIKIKYDCLHIDWNVVRNTLKDVNMAYFSPDIHKKAFENSCVTIFFYHIDQIISFGRAISDGAYQSAIYDVAVTPKFQGMGLGKKLMEEIISRLPKTNIILYTFPGEEEFYRKLKFRKMKTGLALFSNSEKMKKKGITE